MRVRRRETEDRRVSLIAGGWLQGLFRLLPLVYCLLAAEGGWGGEGWREAAPGRQFAFPRDHAAHPDYRIEWWYYTGNLETTDGRRFGYQLTFFRTGVVLEPTNLSRWAVRDLYMTHWAISDITEQRFYSFEKLNRAGVGWAGAETARYRVWNERWEARLDGETHVLSAAEDDFRLELELIAEKPPVIHGEHGVSQKGAAVGNASHYYSLTRLRTTGRITIKGESFVVSGLSWMDHEFGTSFLEQEHVGWDWFSIQLEDGRDLMVFQVRRADGSMDPHSSGTLVERDGRSSLLRFGEFFLTPESSWRSTASGASYPIAWTIAVPGKGLNFFVSAVFPTQELQTNASTGVTYWEGSVSVTETGPAKTLAGHGYLEMTGYAGKSMGAVFGGK